MDMKKAELKEFLEVKVIDFKFFNRNYRYGEPKNDANSI